MVRKSPFGYLGLFSFVAFFFFCSSWNWGNNYSALSEYRKTSNRLASSESEKSFDDEENELSREFNSSEHNDSSPLSHHANNQSVSKIEDSTNLNKTALLSSHQANNQSLSKKNIYYINGTYAVLNPWYGWQPEIHPMDCSWQFCMMDNHTSKTCRDSMEDMAVSNSSSIDPGEDWIPDVTMLRRMFLDGYDANGHLWPPQLEDELCHALGKNTSTKKLLDEAKIVGAPISRMPEKKNNKILCFTYTMEKNHATSIRAMRETWAPGCDGFLAFSTKSDPRIPAISIPHKGREGYRNMWQKVRSMFQFVGKHYLSQFDWFYIGGDDLVVFPQNLKKYLGTYNSSQPFYLGRRFKRGAEIGYNTGGAGYVLSRPALQCLLEHLEDKSCEPKKKTSSEDAKTATCLRLACNITYEDTRDDQKRERFHHWSAEREYEYDGKSKFWNGLNKDWGLLLGKDSCSPETVNFHYIKNPGLARYLFHYVQGGCVRSE
ncbi:unnamed protein product [Cylindrotheca closterium]|uniref:N-acetylgalactosaminide beta-1,3-galactosyltransferase n=1 Tax=Cylindrotheca closterium TaxID=2856 RepID=A0AAD2CSM6_9STRA|nr:unnamed protein product [Cylindrotheca closterium]